MTEKTIILSGTCRTCGGITTREVNGAANTIWVPPACGSCDPIEKNHPEIFDWVQKVVEHQISKAMESHERGHAPSEWSGHY